jgi:tRNA threonylcarbamoyladenosine biosynthesis protein TsaB
MLVLALDTALSSCSVAVLRDGRALADLSQPLAKGHAERLAPMAAEALGLAGVGVKDLDRVGVVIGPGGFAGVRVGLAFARGLALGTKLKVVGVTSLAALAAAAPGAGLRAAVIDARRGEVYAALFDSELNIRVPPFIAAIAAASERLVAAAAGAPCALAGDPALLDLPGNFATAGSSVIDAKIVARLAATAPEPEAAPKPLYLRSPDVRSVPPSPFAARLARGDPR